MKVFIVYCHPSKNCFTYEVKEAWTSSPAMLEGWFQRVWTYGFAYGDKASMKCLEKAIFLITMGGSLKDKVRRNQLEAMKTVMVGDRIRNMGYWRTVCLKDLH